LKRERVPGESDKQVTRGARKEMIENEIATRLLKEGIHRVVNNL